MSLFVLVVAGLFGACVGSFLNVCIFRLPQPGLSVAHPKISFCPSCKNNIVWYDNIPVLSWILLRARCRNCKQGISIRYPMVELLTSALFVLVAYRIHPDASLFTTLWFAELIFWMVLVAILVVISYIDLDHRIIPDVLSINTALAMPWIAWALSSVPVTPILPQIIIDVLPPQAMLTVVPVAVVYFVGAVVGAIVGVWIFRVVSPDPETGETRDLWDCRLAISVGAATGCAVFGLLAVEGWLSQPASRALLASLLGMAAGAGSLYSVGWIASKLLKKDAMGFGDVKLLAVLGALLGYQDVLLSILIACFLGSIIGIGYKIRTGDSQIPFGPFLAAGALFMALAGDLAWAGIDAYLGWFQWIEER